MNTTTATLDDLNFYQDRRVACGRATRPTVTVYPDDLAALPAELRRQFDPVGWLVEIELPWKWAVCPICNGNGKHVNPSIDAGGLTREDFDDDPDFRDDYLAGAYDVPCNHCGGRTTVPAVDEAATDARLLALYREQERDRAQARADEARALALGY